MTSARTSELKETETPGTDYGEQDICVAVPWLHCSFIAVQMPQDTGGGLASLVPTLSLGRKEIGPVYMEQEERIGGCEEKITDCSVLCRSDQTQNVFTLYRPGSNW